MAESRKLFVPRKDQPLGVTGRTQGGGGLVNKGSVIQFRDDAGGGGSTTDSTPDSYSPGEVNKMLFDLERRMQENFRAIERWANRQLVGASIRQSSSHSVTSALTDCTGPWTVLWDEFDLVDLSSNGAIKVPDAGIYQVTASAYVFPGTPTDISGSATLNLSASTSIIDGLGLSAEDNGVVSVTTAGGASFTGIATPLINGVLMATGPGDFQLSSNLSGTTSGTIQVNLFSVFRLGDIPSRFQ